MNVKEATTKLSEEIKYHDLNVVAIGIRENNVKEYDKNPERFISKVKDDSIVVYTYDEPTKKELKLNEYEGFKVTWVKSGGFVC
jgi:hypothetical protein